MRRPARKSAAVSAPRRARLRQHGRRRRAKPAQSAAGPEGNRSACERGAGSVLVLAIVGAVVAVTVALVPVLTLFVHSQHAANAADAAALAAADAVTGAIPATASPCELAGSVARRNHARLIACEIVDAEASVSVAVTALGLELTARARAGPPPDPG